MFDDDDRAKPQGFFNLSQIRYQDRGLLFRPVAYAVSKQDDGGQVTAAERQQRAKIGIGRHKHATFGGGAGKHLLIRCSLQFVVPQMYRIVSGATKLFGDAAGE